MQPESNALASLHDDIARLGAALCASGRLLATAESFTGGLLASTLTDVPGSSGGFQGAVVAYANAVKSGCAGRARSLAGGPWRRERTRGSWPWARGAAAGAGARSARWPCRASPGPGAAAWKSPWARCGLAFFVDGAP
jgi:hypothetical protein